MFSRINYFTLWAERPISVEVFGGRLVFALQHVTHQNDLCCLTFVECVI